MNSFNVHNLPKDTIYQFDVDKFLWKIELNNPQNDNKVLFTEVYEIKDNIIHKIVSGILVDNPNMDKEDRFSILDNENVLEFKQTMPFKEADVNVLCLFGDYLRHNIQNIKK